MENQYVLNKLVNALSILSDSDLRQIAHILKQPNVNEELAKLIESTLALRSAETGTRRREASEAARKSRRDERKAKRNNLTAQDRHTPIDSMEDIQNSVVALLEDRKLFPSTRDVVDSVNKSFQCAIEYEKFRKRGRKPVIRKCLRHLSDFPIRNQIHLLRSFLHKVREESGALDQYRELFRILAGYD